MRDSSAPPLTALELEDLIADARHGVVTTDRGAGQALADSLVAMAAKATPATELAVRAAYSSQSGPAAAATLQG